MVSIAVIGGVGSGRSSLASRLGKKGNTSDVTMYDFAKGDQILTITDPSGYPVSPKPLTTALGMSEIVLLCIPPAGMDVAAGECVIAVDLMGLEYGIVVQTMSDRSNPYEQKENANNIRSFLHGTTARDWDIIPVSTTTFEGMEQLKEAINELGKEITIQNLEKSDKSPRVIIDHSFNVKGIGSVVLGRVIQGTVHKHDKLNIYPVNQEIEIRNIQMQDVDKKSAGSGSRVGLSLKGVQAKDVDRGNIISAGEITAKDIELECKVSRFSQGVIAGSTLHMYINLQSTPVKISGITVDGQDVGEARAGSTCKVSLSTGEEVSFSSGDMFLLTDLNQPKQRFIGGCKYHI
jgi:selenocysteine-specific elongation factor